MSEFDEPRVMSFVAGEESPKALSICLLYQQLFILRPLEDFPARHFFASQKKRTFSAETSFFHRQHRDFSSVAAAFVSLICCLSTPHQCFYFSRAASFSFAFLNRRSARVFILGPRQTNVNISSSSFKFIIAKPDYLWGSFSRFTVFFLHARESRRELRKFFHRATSGEKYIFIFPQNRFPSPLMREPKSAQKLRLLLFGQCKHKTEVKREKSSLP